MTVFTYKAKGADGSVTEGTVDAPLQRDAEARLRGQKLTVIEIKEQFSFNPMSFLKSKPPVSTRTSCSSPANSTLVSAGVPIVQGVPGAQCESHSRRIWATSRRTSRAASRSQIPEEISEDRTSTPP